MSLFEVHGNSTICMKFTWQFSASRHRYRLENRGLQPGT